MQEIIQLLSHWDEYQKTGLPVSFGHFGKWLHQRDRQATTPYPEYGNDPDGLLGYLMGSLIGFAEAWTKLSLRNLPLNSSMDFGILKYIEMHPAPTKKEIARHSIAEDSTIFEGIKRLMKSGLIREYADTKDKRVKRVVLTQKGKQITHQSTEAMLKLASLLSGDLTDDEKANLIDLLRKLNQFHASLYHQTPREQIIQQYQL